MSCQLERGQSISLVKENGVMARIAVGLSWDAVAPDAQKQGLLTEILHGGGLKTEDIDCDLVAILCDAQGRIAESTDMVFFNNLMHPSGAVWHSGDSLSGAVDDALGDAEQIILDFGKVPEDYARIVFAVTIYQARAKHQHFGGVTNVVMRVMHDEGDAQRELCHYPLTEDFSNMTTITFGEMLRVDEGWIFRPIGVGSTDNGVAELARHYQD